MNLYDLVRNNDHEKIAQLDGKDFHPLKAVACINMGRFDEALRYAERGSFEMAYILYKLRRYKRALRILRHISTEASKVLSSQCLYYMGYYNTAYKMFSEVERDDDIVVNLQAMKSLALLAHRAQYRFGNKFLPRKMDDLAEFEDLSRHEMGSAEGYVDFIFNLSFESLWDEEGFVRFLENHVRDERVRGTIVEEQLKNVKGDFDRISMDILSKTQKETVGFNMGRISRFSNPIHFQQNFLEFSKEDVVARLNECLWIEDVYGRCFSTRFDEIPMLSSRMMVFRMLVMYKNGYVPGHKAMNKVLSRAQPGMIRIAFDVLLRMWECREVDRKTWIKVIDGISCGG